MCNLSRAYVFAILKPDRGRFRNLAEKSRWGDFVIHKRKMFTLDIECYCMKCYTSVTVIASVLWVMNISKIILE